ncbi:MAG: carboxylate-amine ligase [Actinomycetota bacterium]|nr:carboxylate-amine ligase [Actinomycetota bacterium]
MQQLYPPSITAGSFAAGGSVLEHKYGQSDPFTLGVEEEYMLLDPDTFDLVQHIDTVLNQVHEEEFVARIAPELMQSVLEISTPVCHNASDADAELRKLRAYVTELGRRENCRVGSAGTHPFSLFERQRITARDRYRALVDQLQYVARRELIFGMHVHVAVDDPEKAIKLLNALLVHLGELLALSANSPFWRGELTGLASTRQMVFAAFPRSGVPPRFRDYTEYAEVVGQLEKTGCIADYTHIWWDIRPHPKWGTIEVRVMDAVTRVEDAVAIAAYIQSLVKHYSDRVDAGQELPSFHRMLVTENKWLAGRYGLEAPVMDLVTGRRNRVPVAQLIRRALREIEPHARELGSDRELEHVRELLAKGNGADRQRRVFNANRDVTEVVREIADVTERVEIASVAA